MTISASSSKTAPSGVVNEIENVRWPSAISGSPGYVGALLVCEKQARQGRRERSYLKSTGATETRADAFGVRLSRARGRRAWPGEPLNYAGTASVSSAG